MSRVLRHAFIFIGDNRRASAVAVSLSSVRRADPTLSGPHHPKPYTPRAGVPNPVAKRVL